VGGVPSEPGSTNRSVSLEVSRVIRGSSWPCRDNPLSTKRAVQLSAVSGGCHLNAFHKSKKSAAVLKHAIIDQYATPFDDVVASGVTGEDRTHPTSDERAKTARSRIGRRATDGTTGPARKQDHLEASGPNRVRVGPVSLVRPTKLPDSFSGGARPACLTGLRPLANRCGSPVSARIAAAPTGETRRWRWPARSGADDDLP
jgi:hypothetical protein